MKKKLLIAGMLIASMLIGACGSAGDKNASFAPTNDAYEDYSYSEEEAWGGYADEAPAAAVEPSEYKTSNTGSGESETFNDSARKLIKTYNISVETEMFDELMANIEKEIDSLHGYIQNLDTYNGSNYGYRSNKSSSLTIRIPVSNLEAFVNFMGNVANVTNKSLSVEDVTMQYVDIKSRKDTYEIEQSRLLAYLEKAETVEEIIQIESRLSEVRYSLESMESQLRTYDNLVNYATIYLSVSEVTKYTAPEPVSYGERLVRSFVEAVENVWDGLKEFLIGFVGAIPGLVLFAIIVTIIVVVIKAIIKRSSKKNHEKETKRAAEYAAKAAQTAEEKARENNM